MGEIESAVAEDGSHTVYTVYGGFDVEAVRDTYRATLGAGGPIAAVWDLRRASLERFQLADLRHLAENSMSGLADGGRKVALVVANSGDAALARLYGETAALQGRTARYAIFENLEAARRWIVGTNEA